MDEAESVAEGASAFPGFGILVLSDFHNGASGQERAWEATRDCILQGLEKDLRDLHPIRLVVFAGDLVHSGIAADYRGVDEFLGRLWNMFRNRGTNPWLIALPGNHDIARGSVEKEAQELFRSLAQDNALQAHFWARKDSDLRKHAQNALSPFVAWQNTNFAHQKGEQDRKEKNAYLERWEGILPGEAAYRLTFDNIKLGAVCLNTAVMHIAPRTSEQDDWPCRNCLLDESQVTSCVNPEWCGENDLNVLATHHPFTWLREEAVKQFRDEVGPRFKFNFYLHGHLHEPDVTYTGCSREGLELHYQSPALYGTESWVKPGTRIALKQRIRGYSLIEVSTGGKNFLIRCRVVIKTGIFCS